MTAQSNGEVVNLFKKVYGNLQDLLPEDQMLAKLIPFSQSQKVGESYVEAVTLTHETGITLGGNGLDVFELESPIAGTVKQAQVTPYVSVLGSLIPWSVISRSAGGGAKAFYDATKYVVKNNLRSHQDFLEAFRLYGQSPDLLGYVSYATATYRGVALTNGTGTVGSSGSQFGPIAFTNGINAAGKYILMAPGQFAAGLWVGKEGVKVAQVDSTGAVVAEGTLVAVDPDLGILQVDFTPVAASGTTSHRMCYKGMEVAKEMIGMHKILTTSGSLFGIPTTQYSLWRGNKLTLANVKFKLDTVQVAVAQAVNRGALEGDVEVLVNPRSFSTLVTTESGARSYDQSYRSAQAENGFENIVFYHQAGKATIRSHRKVKEGHAFMMSADCWSRSGSAEVAFTVPGVDKDIIFPEPNMSAYSFRTYSDQYVFCHAPAKNIFVDGINDESAS